MSTVQFSATVWNLTRLGFSGFPSLAWGGLKCACHIDSLIHFPCFKRPPKKKTVFLLSTDLISNNGKENPFIYASWAIKKLIGLQSLTFPFSKLTFERQWRYLKGSFKQITQVWLFASVEGQWRHSHLLGRSWTRRIWRRLSASDHSAVQLSEVRGTNCCTERGAHHAQACGKKCTHKPKKAFALESRLLLLGHCKNNYLLATAK